MFWQKCVLIGLVFLVLRASYFGGPGPRLPICATREEKSTPSPSSSEEAVQHPSAPLLVTAVRNAATSAFCTGPAARPLPGPAQPLPGPAARPLPGPAFTPPPQGCLLTRPPSQPALGAPGSPCPCWWAGLGGLPLSEWGCLAPLLALWDRTLFSVRGVLNF